MRRFLTRTRKLIRCAGAWFAAFSMAVCIFSCHAARALAYFSRAFCLRLLAVPAIAFGPSFPSSFSAAAGSPSAFFAKRWTLSTFTPSGVTARTFSAVGCRPLDSSFWIALALPASVFFCLCS